MNQYSNAYQYILISICLALSIPESRSSETLSALWDLDQLDQAQQQSSGFTGQIEALRDDREVYNWADFSPREWKTTRAGKTHTRPTMRYFKVLDGAPALWASLFWNLENDQYIFGNASSKKGVYYSKIIEDSSEFRRSKVFKSFIGAPVGKTRVGYWFEVPGLIPDEWMVLEFEAKKLQIRALETRSMELEQLIEVREGRLDRAQYQESLAQTSLVDAYEVRYQLLGAKYTDTNYAAVRFEPWGDVSGEVNQTLFSVEAFVDPTQPPFSSVNEFNSQLTSGFYRDRKMFIGSGLETIQEGEAQNKRSLEVIQKQFLQDLQP